MKYCAAIALAAFAALFFPAWAAAQQTQVTVDHSVFRVILADGSVVPQEKLPGAIISLGDGSGARRRLRIDSVTVDPRDQAGEVMLYSISEQDSKGEWRNVCNADPEGQRLAFPLAGSFTPDMHYSPGNDRILITCTGGAEGKCVRFGYKPWHEDSNGNSLAAYYQTCIRLVRADYCGNGIGHTRNGMPIDIFDRIGIQKDETAVGMSLEAVWGPEGAVCVSHTRLPQGPSLDELIKECPQLAGKTGLRCRDSVPGLLYNRSRSNF
jgi:hypothetical protein